jgi:tetratricopeptide (TPR) repeat protein
LELAAGRAAAFDLNDLVGLLDRRLDLLGDRSTTRESRHRTLRATVEWSYALLDEDEQRLFRALSVFPGGVDLDTVEWLSQRLGLADRGIDAIARLVDASLLVRERTSTGSRYTQLETLRTFGVDQLEQLGECDSARDLAAALALRMLAEAESRIDSPDEAKWIDRLRFEFPNVRAARRHLADGGRVDELLAMSRHLDDWARLREATEVWGWSDDLLERISEGDPRRATALAIHAQALWRRGDISGAMADASEAVATSGDAWTTQHAWAELGAAHLFSGQLDEAIATWSRSDSRPFEYASAALSAAYAGNLELARHLVANVSGPGLPPLSVTAVAWVMYCEAEVDNSVGQADPAQLEEAIAIARSVDASFIVGVATVTLASVHRTRGEVRRAAQRYEELIRHWLRSGSWTQQWTTLRHVAELVEDSDPQTALTILRAAAADSLSPPFLAEASAIRLTALQQRLEARIGSSPAVAAGRVGVAEMAQAACRALAAAETIDPTDAAVPGSR